MLPKGFVNSSSGNAYAKPKIAASAGFAQKVS
jgi:hypothetical protein